MEIAALIISIISLIASLGCLVIMLAKNYFSTHVIQREFVDPFKGQSGEPGQIGNPIFDAFRDLGDPMSPDELDQIELLKRRKVK